MFSLHEDKSKNMYMKTIRSRTFEIIEKAKPGDIQSKIFDWSLVILISLNVLSVILESFPNIKQEYGKFFYSFETISVTIFTVEYILRLWTSDLKYPRNHKIASIVVFIFSGMAIIDFLAILPFYLPMLSIDLRILRILRLARIFRIFKLGRYSTSLQLITRVLRRSKNDILVTVFITLLLMILASALMYYIENPAQPEKYPNIVASAWWTIVTLTTVGYGDVYPITTLGKVLGGIIALLGIGLVALPTGIISSGFMEEIRIRNHTEENFKKMICPHCGTTLNDNIDYENK